MDDLSALEERAVRYPDSADSIHDLADAYADQGDWDRAIEVYKKAIALDELNADLHNSLGTVYEEVEDVDDAEQAYRRAMELAPEDSLAYLNLGALLEEQQRASDAIELYERGLVCVADRAERSEIRRRFFKLVSGTPTGQSPLAYRLAAILLLLGILARVVDMLLQQYMPFPVEGGFAWIVGMLIDLVLVMGLFQLRPGVRLLTLFRVLAGGVLATVLILLEMRQGEIGYAILTLLLQWCYVTSLVLPLTGRTKRWRIIASILLATLFACVSSGLYALITLGRLLRF